MGKINDDAVNEKFATADGKIDEVQAISALEFPLTPPDAAQQSQTPSSAQAGSQGDRMLPLVGIGAWGCSVCWAWLAVVHPPTR